MIDLTQITDEVARTYWAKLPGRPPYDELTAVEKQGLKQGLVAIIHQTAELVEAEVRREVRIKLDSIPRSDLSGVSITLSDALEAVGR